MKNESILVSVVMCTYNTAISFFNAAVESILKQNFKKFELLIVDDGSSLPVDIGLFNDERIRLFRNDTNKGISFSRNLAIQESKGKYIAIMDADDIAEPERLQVEFDYLESNPVCVACGTWFRQFGEKNDLCQRIIDNSNLYKARLLFGNVPTLLDPSCMIRKTVLENHNLKYDESLKCGMDYRMWVCLTEFGEIHNVKQILMNYRTHPNQITKQGYKYLDLSTIEYQFNTLGIKLNETQKLFLIEPLESTKYSLKSYRLFLDEILFNNSVNHYYDQASLEKAICYQWHRKIIHSRNIFYLLKGFFVLKKHRMSILKSFLRHFGLFKSLDRIVDGAN